MSDKHKTKEQLIEELQALRRRVERLEETPPGSAADRTARPVRRELKADIEFIGDFDVVGATGLDVSEGGICFEVRQSLPFEMRFELEGQKQQHRAHLVWARPLPAGGYRLGFRFVPPKPHPGI
jgi:hypothetical protein